MRQYFTVSESPSVRLERVISSLHKKMGSWSVLVLPITNKDSIWSFDHMDAMEISIPDAPREDEMLIAVAVADSGNRWQNKVTQNRNDV